MLLDRGSFGRVRTPGSRTSRLGVRLKLFISFLVPRSIQEFPKRSSLILRIERPCFGTVCEKGTKSSTNATFPCVRDSEHDVEMRRTKNFEKLVEKEKSWIRGLIPYADVDLKPRIGTMKTEGNVDEGGKVRRNRNLFLPCDRSDVSRVLSRHACGIEGSMFRTNRSPCVERETLS